MRCRVSQRVNCAEAQRKRGSRNTPNDKCNPACPVRMRGHGRSFQLYPLANALYNEPSGRDG